MNRSTFDTNSTVSSDNQVGAPTYWRSCHIRSTDSVAIQADGQKTMMPTQSR